INAFQYGDNMTFTQGAHTLKFGGLLIRRQVTEYQTNRGNGRFNFSPAFTDSRQGGATGHSMASFLLGYASLIEQDFTLAWTGLRGWETGLYFADDWRVSRKLTLNLGLRWEYYSPYVEVADRIGNFDPASATVLVAGRDSVSRAANVNKDWRDFAPRFGFAYQAARNVVVRGGYGLFYNPNGNGGALLRLFRHLPYGPINSISPGDVNVATRISAGFGAPPTVNFESSKNPTGGVIGIAPDFRSAYAQQFNLGVQYEIAPWQLIVKAAYVGNLGRRLGTTFDLNQPEPGPGGVNNRRPFFGVRPALAGITYAVSDGLSSYNAFQLAVDKRMSQGLSLMLAYTLGHSIDTVANDFGGGTGTPQDRRCRRCDRGNAGFDLRHRATISYTYELPFGKGRAHLNQGGLLNYIAGGWQLNGITTLQTGLPFSAGLANANTNGAGGSRPDLVGNPKLASDQQSISRWFDVTAFARPTEIRFGNLGRNTLSGPGRVNFDMSLFKNFPITERAKLELRGEAFNIWNHPQFGQPNASIVVGANQIGTTAGSNAGTITSTVGNPRQLQVGARIVF
ncbi:MAG: TonB-dependent receptor domain-containing protein, partial [Bryobacteraceae bacterium]